MTRIIFILMALVITQASYAQEAGGISDEVIAVFPEHFPPYYVTDDDGKPSGFAIEVLNAVAKSANLKIRYVPLSWPEAINRIKQGKAHIIPNWGISEDRKKFVTFSSRLDSFKVSVFTRADNAIFFETDDLSGYTVGVSSSNFAVSEIAQINNVKIVKFETFADMLAALLDNRIDAFAYPHNVTLNNLGGKRLQDKVRMVGQPLKVVERAIAVRKDLSELYQLLNQNLERFIDTEEYIALSRTWLSSDFAHPDLKKMYWLFGASILIFILVILSLSHWARYFLPILTYQDNLDEKQDVDNKYFMLTLFVISLVALLVICIVIFVLYQSSFKEMEQRLSEETFYQANVIEGLGRSNFNHQQDTEAQQYDSVIKTIERGVATRMNMAEITIARRTGDSIEFILRQKTGHTYQSFPTPFDAGFVKPMHLALSGQSGTRVYSDYHNEDVLAAYQYIPSMKLGIVINSDLHEIQAPFIKAAIVSLIASFFIILLGGLVLHSTSERIMKGFHKGRLRFERLFNNANVAIWDEDLSRVRKELRKLRQNGVIDLHQYLHENQQIAWDLMAKVKVVDVNRATLILFRAPSRDKFLYQISRTFGPSGLNVFIKGLCAIWNGDNSFHSETSYYRFDGEMIFATISFQIPDKDSGFKSVPVSIVDITDSKRSERHMRDAQQIIENSPAVLFRWKAEEGWPVALVSDNVSRFGYSSGELMNGDRLYETVIHPEDLERVSREVEEYSAKGIDSFTQEYRIVSPDGDIYWTDDRTDVERDADGNILHYQGIVLDVTERVQAEKQLNIFSDVVERSLNEIYIFDAETLLFINVNLGAQNNLGYSIDELLTMTPIDIKPEFTVDLFEAKIQPLRDKSRSLLNFKAMHCRKDGSQYPADVYLQLIDEDPGVFVAFVIDTSEHEKTEQELQKLVQAVEQSPESIVMTNMDMQIEYVNETFIRTTGYSREEAIGQTPKILKSGQTSVETYKDMWKTLNQGNTWKGEFVNKKKDGEVFWEFAIITPIRREDGAVNHYVAVKEDITEKKRISLELDNHRNHLEELIDQRTAELQKAELKYRTVADFTYDWETWEDSEGEMLYCSPGCERVSGYTREQYVSNPNLLFDIIFPKDLPLLEAHYGEAHVDSDNHHLVFRIRHKDGDIRWVEHFCQAVIDEQGNITGRRASNRDVTDRKISEAELIETRNQADIANQAKSAFLANMSHEIRTPMNAIVGLSHLLSRSEVTPQQSERLDKIDSAANHLLSIINDILDLSKIEAGKFILEQNDFHLSAVVDHVVSVLRDQADSKGQDLVVEESAVPVWLHGDPVRIRQALLNYVGNAIKFSEKGTIYLRSKKLDEQEDKVLIRFEVEDSGIGIEKEKLKRIFEPFEQSDMSTSRQHGGTGLGLAIVKNIAGLMGGEVGAESKPGMGSLFWFSAWLQYGRGIQPSQLKRRTADQDSMLRSRFFDYSILLVEDNAINREVALELLSSVGLSADIAENGVVAVEKFRKNDYDLVLMDIQMPEMDGLEATRLMRSMKSKQEIPILAMSANVYTEDRQACLAAGMKDFITKPVIPDELFDIIDKWLPQNDDRKSEALTDPVLDLSTADDKYLKTQLKSISGLDADKGLRNIRGKTGVYLSLLRQFDEAHSDDFIRIRERLEEGTRDDAAKLAHALKGAAGNLGLTVLQKSAEALEKNLKKGQSSDQSSLLASLESELRRYHDSLAKVEFADEEISQEVFGAIDPDKILAQLCKLLSLDDAGSNDLFKKHSCLLKKTYGNSMVRLQKQIESYRYSEALKALEAIITRNRIEKKLVDS